MFKRILKWLGAITAVLVIAIAIFLINLIWFRPWSLNLFYEKVFAEILFDHPEILSTLGLVEQIGLTGHNGKLDDESPAHQEREFDRWKRDLAQLRQYPVDRQSSSQKLSTRVLDWFLKVQAEGEKWQWHDYPVNQYAPVAEPEGLRLLRDAPRCVAEEVRPSPRWFEDSGTKANPAATFRG